MRRILETDLHGVLEVLSACAPPRLTFTPLPKKVFEQIPKAAALAKIEITHVEIGEIRRVKAAAGIGSRFEGAMA